MSIKYIAWDIESCSEDSYEEIDFINNKKEKEINRK